MAKKFGGVPSFATAVAAAGAEVSTLYLNRGKIFSRIQW